MSMGMSVEKEYRGHSKDERWKVDATLIARLDVFSTKAWWSSSISNEFVPLFRTVGLNDHGDLKQSACVLNQVLRDLFNKYVKEDQIAFACVTNKYSMEVFAALQDAPCVDKSLQDFVVAVEGAILRVADFCRETDDIVQSLVALAEDGISFMSEADYKDCPYSQLSYLGAMYTCRLYSLYKQSVATGLGPDDRISNMQQILESDEPGLVSYEKQLNHNAMKDLRCLAQRTDLPPDSKLLNELNFPPAPIATGLEDFEAASQAVTPPVSPRLAICDGGPGEVPPQTLPLDTHGCGEVPPGDQVPWGKGSRGT